MNVGDRFRNAWNVFRNKNPSLQIGEYGSYYRPDISRFTGGKEKSIVTSILNRIAVDAASVKINHVKTDETGQIKDVIDSSLNYCLTVSANTDQTGRALIQDSVITMLNKGSVAIVPTDIIIRSNDNTKNIKKIRVGEIVTWYPQQVELKVYNENSGRKENIIVSKDSVAIIENPFYSIMNAPNSMMQRLVQKLALLDAIDEHNSSGKLDLIVRLPYAVRGELKTQQAEQRRKAIEDQLVSSKYGIAYVDSTEQITQLNRPIENNLMTQIQFLTDNVYSQLGITTGVLDGTANEETLTNYYSRVIDPILSAIVDEMYRKFLTKTARAQYQTIMYFKDPFKLIPVTKVAEIGDKMKRNEILSSNELRQIYGYRPSKDEKADMLINSNIKNDTNNMNKHADKNEEEGE